MGESQSRYSIVERLTNTKLEIVESKAKIDENLEKKQNKIDDLKNQLTDYEKRKHYK